MLWSLQQPREGAATATVLPRHVEALHTETSGLLSPREQILSGSSGRKKTRVDSRDHQGPLEVWLKIDGFTGLEGVYAPWTRAICFAKRPLMMVTGNEDSSLLVSISFLGVGSKRETKEDTDFPCLGPYNKTPNAGWLDR